MEMLVVSHQNLSCRMTLSFEFMRLGKVFHLDTIYPHMLFVDFIGKLFQKEYNMLHPKTFLIVIGWKFSNSITQIDH